nr:TetR/AcrR family transcriptional regulator [Streptomyces cupreus]
MLAAALEVHEHKGPEGFTVQAVIATSGISLGSLYHHFGSFDGLAAALYGRCMADLLDTLIASLERTRTARTGVHAVVVAYLRFAEEQPAKARFIHASAYAGFLPAHTTAIAAAKAPRIERLLSWLRPHVQAGRVVDLPDPLTEMLLIGPVAETARRWLAGDPAIDLRHASRALPERIWQSLRGPRA